MGKWGSGKLQKVCAYCKEKFWCRHDRIGKFCSRSCGGKFYPKKILKLRFNCELCNKEFFVKRYRKESARFCSIKCLAIVRGKSMQKSKHPNWKGGIAERPYSSRYEIEKRKKEIGKCEKCGSIENLEGHHPKGFKNDNKYIQILCSECHANEHPKLKNFIKRKYG